jgi:hypothetical protein
MIVKKRSKIDKVGFLIALYKIHKNYAQKLGYMIENSSVYVPIK